MLVKTVGNEMDRDKKIVTVNLLVTWLFSKFFYFRYKTAFKTTHYILPLYPQTDGFCHKHWGNLINDV